MNLLIPSAAAIGAAALAMPASAAPTPATPQPPRVDIVYTPAVAVIPEVRTPTGAFRTYRTADGAAYWSRGLPVYRGDRVRLNVFVSTGGGELAETRVRLDNTEIARRTAPPWDVSLDTSNLSEGFHFVEAWARTGGANPRAATDTLVFFVDPRPGEQATNAALPVAPVTADAPPALDPGAGGPAVTLTTDDPEAAKAVAAGAAVRIGKPVEFAVAGPADDEGFIYGLYRGGKQLYRSERMPAGTRIKVRPHTPEQPGLMPGLVWLVVWGAAKDGRLGPPRVAALDVAAASPAAGETSR